MGPRSKTPRRNTGNDISYICRTQTKRDGETGRESKGERVRWESEWEFLSGNRAFTVSYYTEKRRKSEESMVGKVGCAVRLCFQVAACASAVQLSGFMDSLTVENVRLYSGPCSD